jgi:hypothetical protein
VSMTVLSPDGKYSSDKIENTAVIKWRVKYSFDKIENTAVIKWGLPNKTYREIQICYSGDFCHIITS